MLLLLLPLLLLLQMLSRKSDPQPALLRLHSYYIPDFALGRLKATWLQVVMDDMASTPDCDHRGGVRVDSAVTRADDTSVRSHPQLFNGRLRSTTASCGTTASSRRAPPEVVVTAYPAWPACYCFSVVALIFCLDVRSHPQA